MAYSDYSAAFAYKDLATYQKQNQHGANAEYFKSGNAAVTGAWTWTPGSAITPITITQSTNDADSLVIDTSASTSEALRITARNGIHVTQDISNGRALYITRNIAEAGTQPLATFYADNASDTETVLYIRKGGAGTGIDIDQNAAGYGIKIDAEGAQWAQYITCRMGLLITQDVAAGRGLRVYRNTADASDVALVEFVNDNSSNVKTLLDLDQDGNAITFGIDSEATTADVFDMTAVNTSGSLIDLTLSPGGASTAIFLNIVNTDGANPSSGNCIHVHNDGAGAGLYIDQDGNSAGLIVLASGTQSAAAFTSDCSNQYALQVHNDGNNSDRWGMIVAVGTDDNSGTNTHITFSDGNLDSVGSITSSGGTVAYNPFTGSHPSQTKGNKEYPYGMIMSIFDIKENPLKKHYRQPIYILKPSENKQDSKAFGIYAGRNENKKNLHSIYAVGDGHILVCKEGGDIKSGDYLTSSNKTGHGMKQGDDLLHNYTIAKSLEDVNWKKEKKDVKLVSCSYHAN